MAQETALHHPRDNPAMASQRIVTARAEDRLHPRTGCTRTAAFQNRRAHCEARRLERKQIESRYRQIAPQPSRRQLRQATPGRNQWQVFGLDQRHLAGTAALPRSIARQPEIGQGLHLLQLPHRFTPGRADPDPLQAPRPRHPPKQAPQIVAHGAARV